ncbi:MAG: hypothetical protein ACXWWQ_04960 [Candidatus Limnocylindria bacterium]
MTESNRPPDERWSSDEPAAAAPVAPAAPVSTPTSYATSSSSTAAVEPLRRPGIVTAGSITLIVLGALSLLGGVLFMLGGALFAGADASEALDVPPGLEGMAGAFAGMFIFIAILVLIYGALEIWAGINALGGRSWARITGIVLSVIGAALFIGGLLGATEEGANPVLNIVFVAAYVFVIVALAMGGSWFGRRTA